MPNVYVKRNSVFSQLCLCLDSASGGKERSTHAQLILKGFVQFENFRQIVKCEIVNKKPKNLEKGKV